MTLNGLPDASLSGGNFGLLEVLASYVVQVRGCGGSTDGFRLGTGHIYALRRVRRSSQLTARAKKAISAANDFMFTPRICTQRPR